MPTPTRRPAPIRSRSGDEPGRQSNSVIPTGDGAAGFPDADAHADAHSDGHAAWPRPRRHRRRLRRRHRRRTARGRPPTSRGPRPARPIPTPISPRSRTRRAARSRTGSGPSPMPVRRPTLRTRTRSPMATAAATPSRFESRTSQARRPSSRSASQMRILRRQRTRGQGLVEFALVLPIFLLLLFSIVDAGRYAFLNSAMSNAARVGGAPRIRRGVVEGQFRSELRWHGGAGLSHQRHAGRERISRQRRTARWRRSARSETSTSTARRRPHRHPARGRRRPASAATHRSGSSVRVTYSWRATPIISNILGTIHTQASASVLIN